MARRSGQKKTRPPVETDFVHARIAFEAFLRYERARVDRSDSRFALIALELERYLNDKAGLNKLLHALQKRIRETDQLGWLDDRTVGILLPGTDLEGAWIFAIAFERDHFKHMPPVPFTVYCYPENWLHNGNGSGTGKESEYGNNGADSGDNGSSHRKIQEKVESTLVGGLPVWKRTLDLIGALISLILSTPIFLFYTAYIKIVSPGPIFFKQDRVGFKGQPFTFLKFRTMCMDNNPSCHETYLKELINSDKPMEKLDEGRDPRIIFGGRVIRKACIDELPQLINVLKGEMSLVGPRPCLPYEAKEYLRWHKNRFDIRPGITGLWQVSGKNKLTFKQMIRLDISYLRNLSLWLDIKILLLTFPAIIQFVFDAVVNRIGGCTESEGPIVKSEPLVICQVLETFAERF